MYNKGQNKNIQHCGIIVKGPPPDLKGETPFYSLQWIYSGYSGFYSLYLCQAEVFPPRIGEDMKEENWIERVTEMDKKQKKNTI